MMLRHADVQTAAKDWQTYSSNAPFRVPIPSEENLRTMRQLPIETDPPEHTEWRAIVEPFFKRSRDPEVIASSMAAIDGLLLSGGGDIVSLAFGEEPHPRNALQDPARDRMEFDAIRLATEQRMPILGICRGIQILNVALGGTLAQHIDADAPNAIQHFTRASDKILVHSIDIEPDSLLARVLGEETTAVNSWHHQAVDEPGQGLRVSARSRDGVVEAIEAADDRPILGLQCHPEDCSADYPLFLRPFEWLVGEAAKWRSNGES